MISICLKGSSSAYPHGIGSVSGISRSYLVENGGKNPLLSRGRCAVVCIEHFYDQGRPIDVLS